jgi:D-alanyl-lipoteichoic acid acyltransferase DltB (MBOAT superfamily)
MGIHLSKNFNLPFWTSNPAKFWQHWHITLSVWFRDYVYGSIRKRYSKFETSHYYALFITMTLIGLWHSSHWHNVLFGAFWGIALVLHRAYGTQIKDAASTILRSDRLLVIAGTLFTFHLWLFIGAMFIANDVPHAIRMYQSIFTEHHLSERFYDDLALVMFYVSPILIYEAIQKYVNREVIFENIPVAYRIGIYTVLAALLLVNSAVSQPEFIYFQF